MPESPEIEIKKVLFPVNPGRYRETVQNVYKWAKKAEFKPIKILTHISKYYFDDLKIKYTGEKP